MNKILGVSLIELMISTTISLLIIAGVIQVVISTNQQFRVQSELSYIQDRGRVAIDLIKRDIRSAGSGYCNIMKSTTNNTLDTKGKNYDPTFNYFGSGSYGIEGGSYPDTMVIAPIATSAVKIKPPYMPNNAAAIHIEKGSKIKQGDIIVICDATNADVFQVSNTNPTSSGTVVHNTGNSVTPGNGTKNLSKTYGVDSIISFYTFNTWDIKIGGNGRNALFRNGAEVVENVDDMQITYGQDTNSDGSADLYTTADKIIDSKRVKSIRFSLLLSTEDNIAKTQYQYQYNNKIVKTSDRKIRKVFGTTMYIGE